MSGLLQIFCEPTQDEVLRIRIRHTQRDHLSEATAEIPPIASPEDREAIRWYLEEYLLYPFDPAPEVAARVEKRMQEIGAGLFRHVFESSSQAAEIWLAIRATIAETRFEVLGGPAGDLVFWELIHNPLDSIPIACAAQAFVRISDREMDHAGTSSQRCAMRVLLVIARPGGSGDIRFRSVAARVLHRLGGRGNLELEVLRPPTFDALERKLRSAQTRGQPFTIVHFDGHGIYEDLMAKYAGRPPATKRGYLMFEDPDRLGKPDPIDGERFAELLTDYGVSIVLLNACRSARSELSSTPSPEEDIGSARSFGSFAGELIGAGVGAVVAMQYNIYVDTAAQFVTAIYERLASAETLAEAVTHARRDLFENPRRTSVSSPRDLRDWMVPVLFESYRMGIEALPAAETAPIDTSTLPPPPSSGFVGRDNALLELDREFQSARVVAMWGQVGSGKTATAVEFARWLAQTGGVVGPVLFTSFREHLPLHRVVDEAASAFQPQIEAGDIEWLTLDDSRRVRLLIELLRGIPCFWIWDNVESIGKDGWATEEVEQLSGFLAQAAGTEARILLTSRDRHLSWAADCSSPLELPPMDMAERLELAVSIAGPAFSFPEEVWTPLFQFSQGNPFVLSLLVRQAVMKRIDSPAGMAAFLDGIHVSGGAELFGASIEYVVRNQFSAPEQTLLSVSCLFEGAVNEMSLDFLSEQRDPDEGVASLPKGPSRCAPLLERVAKLGVLASIGSGYYSIHPGLPIHLRRIYSEHYTPQQRSLLERGFVWLHATIARLFADQYQSGASEAADISFRTLSLNEPNFKRALHLARAQSRWYDVMSLVRGFRVLLGHGGRWTEFARMVDEVEPDFIDPLTGAALPGRESFWIAIEGYRVDVLMHSHRLNEADRLQRAIVDRGRVLLRSPDPPGTKPEESTSTAFAGCLQQLATIQKDLGSKECIKSYQEALELAQRVGDTMLEHAVAYQMAGTYMEHEFCDLDAAGYWLTYALDLTPAGDRIGRGLVLTGLGTHAYLQMNAKDCPPADRRHWLAEAIRYLEMALQVLPAGHAAARAACHANLGLAYYSAGGDLTRAVNSFQQALASQETSGDYHQAGVTRLNLARVLESAGDLKRSHLFADAALRTFASLAPDAEQELVEVQDFIETLQGEYEQHQSNAV